MKKITLLLLSIILYSHCLKAQHSQRLINNWQFIKQDLGSIWEGVRPVPNGGPESVPLWDTVSLPHCYNALDAVNPDVNYYQGLAWYRTLLTIDNPYSNGRILLHLEGVGQKGEVYIYAQKVGSHVGGYDEWTIDLTEAINEFKKNPVYKKQFKGKVPLLIRTDNSRDTEMIPSDMSDFNLYGGLYRHVNLVYVPELSVEKLFVRPELDLPRQKGTITITPRFYNPYGTKNVKAGLRLYGPSGKLVLAKESSQTGPLETAFWNIELNRPELWSPDKPLLYTIETTFSTTDGTVTHKEKFGFRSFLFMEKGPFMLNGKRLLLRGTHRHEDHAGVAAAMTDEMTRKEMVMMKEMGVNFIRLGHYQQSKQVLDLCDSLGILVWEEIPWCRGGLGGQVYQEQGKRMLANMIEQHYNHPSIIIWGLGNENDWPGDFPEFDQQKIRAHMKELHELSHRLDPSRKTAIRRCDFCKDIVDVYSPSIWAGWYRGLYSEYQKISANEMQKTDHFLHVEWGADSHAGRHAESPDVDLITAIKIGDGGDERTGDATFYGGQARVSKDGDWSETYQCNLIDWHLKEQENMTWLSGTAYWPFKDFSTPLRPENPVPYVNQKGVTERDLTPKEAYYVFQSYWATKPMLHIYGHNWPIRWGNAGEEKMVKIYSNCIEVELWLNGKNQSKKKRDSQDFPAAGLHWNLVFNEGRNQLIAKGKKDGITVTDTVLFEYQAKKWSTPAAIKITKKEITNGLVTVHVQLVDANGTPCLDAKNYFEFDLAGDGTLIKNLGTSTASSKVQAFNGRGAISVKTNGSKSTLYIKSPGIKTIAVEI